MTWSFRGSTGVLSIQGTGDMYDIYGDRRPWDGLEDSIRSVVIGEGVTNVADHAFNNYEYITSISFPSTLKEIGDYAFSQLRSLENLTLPSGLLKIGEGAFDNCYQLTDVVLPNGLLSIGGFAFNSNYNLKSLYIPASVITIGERIAGYSKLIVDPENATFSSDASGVLFNKDKTILIEAPKSLTGKYVIPASVTEIAKGAFHSCYSLTAVTLPEGLKTIGYFAFQNCSMLKTVIIPASVSTIEWMVFTRCNLESVIFAGSFPAQMSESAFDDASFTAYYPQNDASWTDDVLLDYYGEITWVPYEGIVLLRQLQDRYVISGQTVEIAVDAFGSELTYEWYVAAPGSDTFIKSTQTTATYSVTADDTIDGQRVYCIITDGDKNTCQTDTVTITLISALQPGQPVKVPINAGQSVYYAIYTDYPCEVAFGYYTEGAQLRYYFYDAEMNLQFEGTSNNFATSYSNGPGLLCIFRLEWVDSTYSGTVDIYRYDYHKTEEKVITEAGCTVDGEKLIYCVECDYSYTEKIPASHIYEDGYCTRCESEAILSDICGDDLTWEFRGSTCTLTISGTGEMYDFDWSDIPWQQVRSSIKKVVIGEGVTNIMTYAFLECTNLKEVSLPTTLTTIKNMAFAYCAMPEIVLPVGLKEIQYGAFSNCEHLTEVVLPEGLTTVGEYVFGSCPALERIVVPASVSSIGLVNAYAAEYLVASDNPYYCSDVYGALYDKEMKTLLHVPSTFEGVFVVPDTVVEIADEAFSYCADLTGVKLPEGLEIIGSAFLYCDNLRSIIIPSTVNYLDWAVFGESYLKAILFLGDAPTMQDNTLYSFSGIAYYPADNSTWTADVMKNYEGKPNWQPYSGSVILRQPADVNVVLGQTDQIVVEVYGTGLTYQWWVAEPGTETFVKSAVTSATYPVTGSTANDGQQVYCVITDEIGNTLTSDVATIHLIPTIKLDEKMQVSIDQPGKTVYYTFTPTQTCWYVFQSFGTCDPYCELLDDNWKFIKRADDEMDYNFRLEVELKAGKTYILAVRLYNNEATAVLDVMLEQVHAWKKGECLSCGTICSHSYVDGLCEICGVDEPVDVVIPNLKLVSPTLNLEDEIYYNIYYTVSDLTDVVEMGLITFSEKLTNGTIDDALEVIPGYVQVGNEYMSHTNGIPAKNLGDALYFKAYAKLSDGTYAYSSVAGYHAVAYAQDRLANSTSQKTHQMVVAMLNYGAAAQIQFNYKTDSLMNAFLTDAQKALVSDYSADMVDSIVRVDAAKVGEFAAVSGSFSYLYPNVAFEGAFSINYYFAPAKAMDGDLTLYYWNLEDYNTADVLTKDNATGSVVMGPGVVAGEYLATVQGIAAKEIDQTVFVAGVYESNGTTCCTGVIAYSLATYCQDRIANGTETMQAFAKATVVYGYYAKQYFA